MATDNEKAFIQRVNSSSVLDEGQKKALLAVDDKGRLKLKGAQRRRALILLKIKETKGRIPKLKHHDTIYHVDAPLNEHGHLKRHDVPVDVRDNYIKIRKPDALKRMIFKANEMLSGSYGAKRVLRIKNIGKFSGKLGNDKPIPNWIFILSTSPAIDCSTRHCGACEFYRDCYALGNEAQGMLQYGSAAMLGNVVNAKRKFGAVIRKMMHEADPSAFADAILDKNKGKTKTSDNPNAINYIRWNEAGDVKDGDELIWVARSAALLWAGVDSQGNQRYWKNAKGDSDRDKKIQIASTIYTHRRDIYQDYLEKLDKLSKEERDLIKEGFTIMGSGFMATNEFRAVHEFSTQDYLNQEDHNKNFYTTDIYGNVYSTARDVSGKIRGAEGEIDCGYDDGFCRDEQGNLVTEDGNRLFPVYHCSSNCELCFAQYGVGLCYAPDLKDAIIEERIRENNPLVRSMVTSKGGYLDNDYTEKAIWDGVMALDANNPNNYMDDFAKLAKLAGNQKRDTMWDLLKGQEIDGDKIKKKSDLSEKYYFDWASGQYRDTFDKEQFQEAFYMNDFVERAKALAPKLSKRDQAYLQHYFNYAYKDGIFFAHDKPLTQTEWDTIYGKNNERLIINPNEWGNR